MTAFSVYEQLLLELINRARLDPLADVKRLGIGLNTGLERDRLPRKRPNASQQT